VLNAVARWKNKPFTFDIDNRTSVAGLRGMVASWGTQGDATAAYMISTMVIDNGSEYFATGMFADMPLNYRTTADVKNALSTNKVQARYIAQRLLGLGSEVIYVRSNGEHQWGSIFEIILESAKKDERLRDGEKIIFQDFLEWASTQTFHN
jgi:hypothetical protein